MFRFQKVRQTFNFNVLLRARTPPSHIGSQRLGEPRKDELLFTCESLLSCFRHSYGGLARSMRLGEGARGFFRVKICFLGIPFFLPAKDTSSSCDFSRAISILILFASATILLQSNTAHVSAYGGRYV